MPNNEFRIFGFKTAWRHQFEYAQPFTVPDGLMNFPIAPENLIGAPVNNARLFQVNNAQSTHTHSVHKTVTESINKLHLRYHQKLNTEKNIKEIKEFVKNITANNFPDTTELQREAAKRFIARMEAIFEEEEKGSKKTIKHILSLLWEGMNDTHGACKVTKEVAQEKFIKHLYEIQRGYNFDARGRDNGQEDLSICIGGTINKLVDVLNGNLHTDVFIAYITKETAGAKLTALVIEKTIAYIQKSDKKEALIKEIDELKTPVNWGILDSILKSFKNEVRTEFYEEFNGSLDLPILNSIFEQYEYVSLSPDDFKKISGDFHKLEPKVVETQIPKLPDNKPQIELNEAEEQRKRDQKDNSNEEQKYVLLSKKLEALTTDYLNYLKAVKKPNDLLLKGKIDLVSSLFNLLQPGDSITNLQTPVARVTNFYEQLNKAEIKLKAHRDPNWRRYIQNTLIVAGILLTGILPGLIALTIYTHTGNKVGKSFQFWHSRGTEVVNQVNEMQNALQGLQN